MSFEVVFNSKECKGCDICIASCKLNLLEADVSELNEKGIHPVTIKDQSKCVGCTNCALMCPDAVITINKID